MNAKETSVIQNIIQNEGHYLQLFFDQMQEAYALHEMLFDSEGAPYDYLFLEGNSRFEELTGLSFEQIKGQTVLDVLPDTDPELIRQYGQVVLSGEPFQDIIYVKEADKYYNVSAFRVGKKYFATLFYDVTQQEKIKRKLEDADQERERLLAEYETVFHATKEAIFLVEVMPDQETFVFIRNNLYHQQTTGLTQDMIAGKTPVELLGPEVGGFVDGNYRRCVEAGESIRYEEELDLIGGKRIWLTELHPIFSDSQVRYVVGSSTDITEMREKEHSLQAALKKAEEASQVKGIFLSTINHEFRTPMNSIIGLAHLIKNMLDPKEHADVFLYLQDIQSSAQELLTAISDILDYADLTLSETKIKEQPLSFLRMLREIERLHADDVSRKRLGFSIKITDSFSDSYLGDEGLIKKVLSHVVGNAIKYTPEGSVDISVAVSSETPEAGQVQIAVADTGVGISPDKLDTVFEPFLQEDESVNRRFQGIGLGLPIVRGILEKMNGNIAVAPGPQNKGTVVTISIPMKKHMLTAANYKENIRAHRVEYDDTLKKLGGSKEIYHDVLERYEQYAETILQKIIEASETGQLDELRIQLHNLKGMSLNVGAITIADIVLAAELKTKDNKNPSDEINTLVTEFTKVVSEIRLLLKKGSDSLMLAKDQRHFDQSDAEHTKMTYELLMTIYNLVESHSLIEESLLDKAKKLLRNTPAWYVSFSTIIAQLDAFDYANAKLGLAKLLQKMEGDRHGK